MYLSAYQKNYWNYDDKEASYSINYSSRIWDLDYTINYSYTKSRREQSADQILSINLQIPFKRWLKRTWGSYGIQNSFNQRLLQQINIHHSPFADESLFLTLQQNYERQYENHTNSISSALYGQYRNQYAILNLGYNHDPHQNQLNYGLQGSLVAHPYGLTLAQPIGETAALVIAKDAVEVKLENHSGIKTDYQGIAIIPNISSYRTNQITLATETLPDGVDIESNIQTVTPLIADDTLIAKTRSKKIVMVHYQYSGNEHDVIAGIGLVNLLWHDLTKVESIPINYRIYDKDSDGKTKNTHFSEMLTLAKKRGIMPEAIVMDAWYSSLDNLKSIRSHGWIWVTTLRKNRIVNHNKQLNKLDISEEGTSIHLRGYGWVTVFKFTAKNGRIDYIVTNKENPTRQYLKSIMDARWSVEVYHREVKQNCGIERCQARTSRAQRNHIFLAISAWFEQHKRRISEKITLYQQNWDVIKSAITEQIRVLLAYPN